MYAIAIIGDLLSLVPYVNFVSAFGTAVALSMFASDDEDVLSSDNAGGTLLTFIIEAIPGISTVPAWTTRVYLAKRRARQKRGD
jgi:hypothetical protein